MEATAPESRQVERPQAQAGSNPNDATGLGATVIPSRQPTFRESDFDLEALKSILNGPGCFETLQNKWIESNQALEKLFPHLWKEQLCALSRIHRADMRRADSVINTLPDAGPRAPSGTLEFVADKRLWDVPTDNEYIRRYAKNRSWNQPRTDEHSSSTLSTDSTARGSAEKETIIATGDQPKRDEEKVPECVTGADAVVQEPEETLGVSEESEKALDNSAPISPLVSAVTTSFEEFADEEEIPTYEGSDEEDNVDEQEDLFFHYSMRAMPQPPAPYFYSLDDYTWGSEALETPLVWSLDMGAE